MDLLIELYGEDIPPRHQRRAILDLDAAFRERFRKAGVEVEDKDVTCLHTARRLTLCIHNLPGCLPVTRRSRRGPPTDAPQHVTRAFAKQFDVNLSQCQQVMHRERPYYMIELVEGGETIARHVLPWLQDIVAHFRWPKAMRFGTQGLSWIRPLRQVMIMCDGIFVEGSVLMDRESKTQPGNGNSNDRGCRLPLKKTTRGHSRFNREELVIAVPADYVSSLEAHGVMVDTQKRRRVIAECVEQQASSQHDVIPTLWLDELADMAEWPRPITLPLPVEYDSLPTPVVRQVLWQQQKIIVFEQNNGRRGYLFVLDRPVESGVAAIRKSLDRVVRARLDDALALIEEDRFRFAAVLQSPSKDWSIAKMALLDTLGVKECAERKHAVRCLSILGHVINDLAIPVSDDAMAVLEQITLLRLVLSRAAMIEEYPDLESQLIIMLAADRLDLVGSNSLSADVLRACSDETSEFKFNDDTLSVKFSSVLRYSDALETLMRLCARHGIPTGSEDPFALRSRAQDILSALSSLAGHMRYDLGTILSNAAPKQAADTLVKDVQLYLMNRLDAFYQNRHQRVLLSAIRAQCSERMADLLVIVPVMAAYAQNNESDFDSLLQVSRRTANILRKSPVTDFASSVDESKLQEPSEQALWRALKTLPAMEDEKKPPHPGSNDRLQFVEEGLNCFVRLAPKLERFFNDVRINVDDQDIRANRLAILHTLQRHLEWFADFTLISTDHARIDFRND